MSWKQLGIQASGRTQYLETNYRNTQPILSLATIFAAGSTNGDEDEVRAPWVDPNKYVRLLGSSSVLLQRQNKQAEVERVVRIVGDLLNGLWFGEKVDPPNRNKSGYSTRRLEKLIELLASELPSTTAAPSAWQAFALRWAEFNALCLEAELLGVIQANNVSDMRQSADARFTGWLAQWSRLLFF